jgi:hypothetical protein
MNGNPFGSPVASPTMAGNPFDPMQQDPFATSSARQMRHLSRRSTANSNPTDRVTSPASAVLSGGSHWGGCKLKAQGLTDSPKVSIRLSTRLNLGRLSRNIRKEHLQAYGGYHSSSASTKCKLLSPYDGAIASLGNKSRMRLLGSATELAMVRWRRWSFTSLSISHPLSLCSPLITPAP